MFVYIFMSTVDIVIKEKGAGISLFNPAIFCAVSILGLHISICFFSFLLYYTYF
jgi:hypothetical protein